jgi:sensor histidine kinase YesM
LPPFWQTWWFRTLCISFVAFLAYWFFRKRIKNIRHQAEMKHKIAETEMMALRAQMNPHFIFNCLNAIDNMIQINQKEKATTYLNRFAKLIRGVLDSSKNNLVPLHKDVEILKLYLQLEQFRCNNGFDYHLQVEPSLLNGDYKIPPLIVQPFLENAIHHGLMNKETGERCLEVSVQLMNDAVKYTIKDNGVGRRVANDLKQMNKPEHQSYGIQISTDRIMMHNNNSKASEAVVITDLYVDKNPAGTLIEVFIKADR